MEVTRKLFEGITHRPDYKTSEPWLSTVNQKKHQLIRGLGVPECHETQGGKAVGQAAPPPVFKERAKQEERTRCKGLTQEPGAAQSSSPPRFGFLHMMPSTCKIFNFPQNASS